MIRAEAPVLSLQLHVAFELGLSFNDQDFSTKLENHQKWFLLV